MLDTSTSGLIKINTLILMIRYINLKVTREINFKIEKLKVLISNIRHGIKIIK